MNYIVTIPHDPVWRALTWTKENCPSYITNQGRPHTGSTLDNRKYVIDYYFGEERDAVLFALKWK